MSKDITAFIGLGGNVGNVFSTMQTALQHLNKNPKISIKTISSVYKTPPWGVLNQDWFLNLCVSLQTSLASRQLLAECLLVEESLNRERTIRWGPRTIDIDILVYGDENMSAKELQLPHPRMQERGFVLLPLIEIAPCLQLNGQSISYWLEKLDTNDIQKTDLKITL